MGKPTNFSPEELNQYIELTKCDHNDPIRRVWAAFGQPGGGWEFTAVGTLGQVVNSQGTKPCDLLSNEYNWMLQPVLPYSVFVIVLRAILYFARNVGSFKAEPSVKEIEGLPCLVLKSMSSNRYDYTMSVAFKKGKDENNIWIKLWGAAWEDQEDSETRRLYTTEDLRYEGELLTKAETSHTLTCFYRNKSIDDLQQFPKWLVESLKSLQVRLDQCREPQLTLTRKLQPNDAKIELIDHLQSLPSSSSNI